MRQPAQLRGERTAAVLLLAGGPVAALGVLAVCALAALLVPAGWWRPEVVAPLAVAVAVAVAWLARWIPVRGGPPVPVWSAVACLAVAVAFAVWAAATHGEHLVLRRDAGSYALYAQWLGTRHGLPVDADLAAFGGPRALSVPGFTLDSPAFYQVVSGSGSAATAQILPQFLLGAPALYSLGWWLGGWGGLFVVPAVLGGLALLGAGGLTARIVGPRWAPLACAGLALTQPVLHAARTTFSEPAALVIVLGAAALTCDALDPRSGGRAGRVAVLAGALLGLAALVRVDAVREVALVVPVCTVLWIRRHPAAVPLGVASAAGVTLAAVPAVWLARPYLRTVAGSLGPLVAATVALLVAGLVAVAAHRVWERRRAAVGAEVVAGDGCSGTADRVLPALAAGLVVLAGLVLASRPWWMVARQAVDDPGNALVASLQAQQGLPVDGARTYAEQSVGWVTWYVGIPAGIAALAAFAAAAAGATRWWVRSRRLPAAGDGLRPAAGDGLPPRWLVAALVGLGSVVLILYRPGITPDHPWADRRLVPVVLPAVVVAATAAAARGVRYARRRMPVGVLVAAVLAAVLAIVVPAAVATRPVASSRTEVGEPKSVAAVCAQLRPGDVVVGVTDASGGIRAQNEWVQVIRGVCGRPSAALLAGTVSEQRAALGHLAALIGGAGGRLVLLSAAEDDGSAPRALAALGQQPRRAVLRHTTEDQHVLVRRPSTVSGLVIDVWLATWRSPAGG
ncbi:MAG TPA: hypothetical protein VI248_22050 [Kineosporiaceae bacterium]